MTDIRAFASHADYRACVELQYETWGRDFKDAVPASILQVSQRLGGVAVGAFEPDGSMAGFVFGITGVERGSIVHWSDMLAVRPNVQNTGIGRRLKEFQRAAVARVGGQTIYWTYDPLVARNAHLNFNVFGVRVAEYARDMYGNDTGSDLHRGIGTDRLIVAWPVADAELATRRDETAVAHSAAEFRTAPIIGDADQDGPSTDIGRSHRLRIAVPRDIGAMQRSDPSAAARCRSSTRTAFESALAAHYSVDGFYVEEEHNRGFYLLSKRR